MSDERERLKAEVLDLLHELGLADVPVKEWLARAAARAGLN